MCDLEGMECGRERWQTPCCNAVALTVQYQAPRLRYYLILRRRFYYVLLIQFLVPDPLLRLLAEIRVLHIELARGDNASCQAVGSEFGLRIY